MADKVNVMVDGGKANAGPLGPTLGPLGVRLDLVVKEINQKTAAFAGMKVPVTVIVEKDKSFSITVGTPPTTSLIRTELQIELGAGNPKSQVVGDLSIDQVIKIARMKESVLVGRSLKSMVREVIGTCTSMGVTVDGLNPREAHLAVVRGEYDSKLGA